jgi:starch synthase (maltosyl-transferring)
VPGQKVNVRAFVISDGHDEKAVALCYRHSSDAAWKEKEMSLLWNDEYLGDFPIEKEGVYLYKVKAWIDEFKTWQDALKKRIEAKQDIKTDLMIGLGLVEEAAQRAAAADRKIIEDCAGKLKKGGKDAERAALSAEIPGAMKRCPDIKLVSEYCRELAVHVDREKAGFSAWYEMFPRSSSGSTKKHGTFRDCEKLLPEIAEMGFDVLYFPPIHPIGVLKRKGRNNSLTAAKDDPGSPWAVGAERGGHKAILPELGTFEDFDRLAAKAKKLGLEIALDIAFQCSNDHPYIKEHPEWFTWRPDKTIQHAENPPKKYEDIVPFNFRTENWKALWEELKSVFIFWAQRGVRIFRVDNPHTKPFAFWEWVIAEVKKEYPDALFLAEAFTKPKVMYRLAKLGFTQSYTYFTWRNTKYELCEYINDLTKTDAAEFFRPNFWPNTPDILHEYLQKGGRPAFIIRLVLAATLSPNYGMYGGAYITCRREPFPGKEEYIDNEKYEIKNWDLNAPGNIKQEVIKINKIRKGNRALQGANITLVCGTDNDNILAYARYTDSLDNIILCVVNLDPHFTQAGWVDIPHHDLGIAPDAAIKAMDLLSGEEYAWNARRNFVKLDPQEKPAHVFLIKKA